MVDVRDCFLRMIIGGELSEYFGLPGLSPTEAREVRGVAGRGDESSTEAFGVSPNEISEGEMFPFLRCLPMGFAWSLWFAQDTNEHVAGREPLLAPSSRISDRGPPPVFSPHDTAPKHYVYVDNLGVMGLDPALVNRALDGGISALESAGLETHERAFGEAPMDILGIEVNAVHRCTRLTD